MGLLRDDGKRPDGLTLIPWRGGRPLTWDVTVIHPLADSYVATSSREAGASAELAAERKLSKYAALSGSCLFTPIAFETLGPVNKSARDLISHLGSRISSVSGDLRETAYLFQRISILLQRFNAILVHDSFMTNAESDI